MPEESATPDLVALTRRQFEAVNRRDMDAVMSPCPPDIDEGRAAAERLAEERE